MQLHWMLQNCCRLYAAIAERKIKLSIQLLMHSKVFIPQDETPESVIIAIPSSITISMLLLSDLWRCQHQLLAAKLKDENMTGKCLEL